MTTPPLPDRSTRTWVCELREVTFYATAHDLAAGRVTLAEVAHRLRRDAEKTTEPTRSRRYTLAAAMDRAAADERQADG